jgi:hypothetical protein
MIKRSFGLILISSALSFDIYVVPINAGETTLGACVVPCRKVIEPSFIVTFFLGELESHSITDAVALCLCSSTGTGEEFLTERQLEDAATPHLTRPRERYFVFKERAPSRPAASG